MFSSSCTSVYESKDIRKVTGDTIRPGGFKLTNKAVQFCNFGHQDNVLDLGCGIGTTVAYLQNKHNLASIGVDPSKKLLKEAKIKHPDLDLYQGCGEEIPIGDNKMKGVFCECTLSLMDDKDKALAEIYKVLKAQGYLIISDVYARKPSYIEELEEFNLKSCIRGVHDIESLKEKLVDKGFEIKFFADYTDYLKEMMVQIIFEFGSMNLFWQKTGNCNLDIEEFKKILVQSKVGYFLLIAQKIKKGD